MNTTKTIKFLFLSALTGAVVSCAPKAEAPKEEPKEDKFPAFDLANLDKSVAPCNDFFHYSGGGWVKDNPIPGTESRWGQFNILIEENNKKIRGILEEFSGKDGLKKGSDEQLIGDLYYSAMDSSKIEKDGLKYVQPYFDALAEVKSLDDYVKLMAEQEWNGISIPFGIYVGPDAKNSSMNVLYMSQSGLGLPGKGYYEKTDSVSVGIQNKYKEHVAKVFMLLNEEEAKAKELADIVYKIENGLAKVQMSRVERRNPEATYNKMTMDELKAKAPQIPFDIYFDIMGVHPEDLIVGQPEYMAALGEMLTSIPLDEWKVYSRWHIIDAKMGMLPKAYVEQNFDFYSRTLRGTKEMKPRWKRALGATNGLSEQLGHLFVNKYFPEESKAKVEQMVENLRAVYKERIMGLEWMSDATKEKALEKLAAFTYKIGYPNSWKDYSTLDLSKESYLTNMTNLGKFLQKENLAKLGKAVDKSEWLMGPHIVNAYYYPPNNEVVFPAGILQPPFFNPDADDAINYGAIGGVIGHEFTHGFDDQGSKYGADGNLEDWWTPEDKAKFQELAGRVVAQYDGYSPLEGVNVNGQLTLGENIADFGGITLAYHAYKKSIEGKERPADIDGFSPEQRVFLGWAQVWQTSSTDAAMRNQVQTDYHSPAHYRVIGPMSNMKEFEEAWGCAGEMSRPDSAKITIW